MFVRNLLKAGDFATVVPVGINATLQYSESGILEKIYLGFDYKNLEDNPELIPLLLRSNIPSKILLRGGTTFVQGCFHSSKYLTFESNTKVNLLDNIEEYQFFAGNVISYSATFRGSVPIRQWLSGAGFSTLPGYVIPAELNDSKFKSFLESNNYPFEYPLITSYIVFNNGNVYFKNTDIKQYRVNDISRYVNEYGYVKCKLNLYDFESSVFLNLDIDYSEAILYKVISGSIVTLDNTGSVLFCCNKDSSDILQGVFDDQYECPECGKISVVPDRGSFKCSNSHCPSNMYVWSNEFIKGLGLQPISYSEYDESVKMRQGAYTPLTLLEYLKEYRGLSKIRCNLQTVLRSCLPRTVIPNKQQILQLCQACNYSKSSLLYYFVNPEKLLGDLNLDEHLYSRLVTWLKDSFNSTFVETVFNHPCIEVYEENRYFDGPPILNNKKIYITGKFKHGSKDDIYRILKSYYADIVDDYKSGFDMIVVGDTQDGVNGMSIQYARSNKLPIFSESDFFSIYGINDDIKNIDAIS